MYKTNSIFDLYVQNKNSLLSNDEIEIFDIKMKSFRGYNHPHQCLQRQSPYKSYEIKI